MKTDVLGNEAYAASGRPKNKRKFKFDPVLLTQYIVLLIMTVIMVYPLFLILNISMKTYQQYLNNPNAIVPFSEWNITNYQVVWKKLDVFRKLGNSLGFALISTVINCFVSLLAAFPISRNHFKSSGKVYTFVLASMFFPGSLVATIVLMKNVLFIYGTPLSLIMLWGLGGLQLNIFMMVGFVKQLPKDLDEAAWIDGCGYYRYILTIALPLMLPIISTVFTFKFIGCWNDFLTPYIYLENADLRPLATGLFFFRGEYSSRWQELSAAIILVCLPMVVLYVFMQRFIISGLTSGALKG